MTETAGNVVELKNVYKSYERKPVLLGANLSVRRSETLVVLGPSGTGKSVMLRHINGLEKPDKGEVVVFGEEITDATEEELIPIRLRVSMLFQGGALFDSLNVSENVAFPLREHTAKTEEEIRARVAETLRMVGLPGTQKKMPDELSGGMKKRVALARSIALAPEMILFDEPTTGLDPLNAEKISELICDLNKSLHATFVVVTHDIALARLTASRVAFLHEGRFEFIGTFDEAAAGAHPMLAEFFHSQKFPCGHPSTGKAAS